MGWMMPRLSVGMAVVCAGAALWLSGCGTGSMLEATPGQSSLGEIRGVVHGGSQVIGGSHIYVFAAGTTGYGGSGIAASTANASVSVMNSVTTGAYPTAYDSTLKAYYVTSDANGNFGISGDYTCTSGTQIYLYALGGNPGTGSNNPSAGLLAALGQCPPTGGSLASEVPLVVINEASTIATAYALAGFATDATHISSSGTALAQTGIANALANAGNLYAINGSSNGANALTQWGNGTVPQAEINSLANSLAVCVNAPSSTQCVTLFANAKSGGSTGMVAIDTATAAINIAHNPGNAVATIFGLPVGLGAPFQPTLSAAPNDFTIGINLTGGGLNYPWSIAIDGSGNAWVANLNTSTVSKFSSKGTAISPATGYAGGGLNNPVAIAIDGSGNAWIANDTAAGSVSKLSSAGAAISPSTGYTATSTLYYPSSIAIDGLGNAWIVESSSIDAAAKFSSTGTALSPGSGYTGGGLYYPIAVAVDGSGSAWAANYLNTNIDKLSYTGSPLAPGNGYAGYSGSGESSSEAIAVDGSGNAWVVTGGVAVLKFSNAGVITASTYGGGLSSPDSIAIDGSGGAWVANEYANSISQFSSTGAALSPSTGYTGGSLNKPYSIAIDGSGDVWIANENNNSVSELIGVAAPVITPICAGLPSTPTANGTSSLGTRP